MHGTDSLLVADNLITYRFGLLRFMVDTCKYFLRLLMCTCFVRDCVCWIYRLSFVWLIVLDFLSYRCVRSNVLVLF